LAEWAGHSRPLHANYGVSNMGIRKRLVRCALLCALAWSGVSGSLAWADGTIELTAGFVKVLAVKRAFKTAASGNPAIADVRPGVTDRAILIFGKAVGTTNFVILDEADREVFSAIVKVTADAPEPGRLVIVRGILSPTDRNKVSVFGCAPRCILHDDPPSKVKRTVPWPGVPDTTAAAKPE
jgi:Flp pilus assembly secretin CpaC